LIPSRVFIENGETTPWSESISETGDLI